MPIHDAYLRRTPYELILPDREEARERFTAFEAEAEERGGDVAADPEAFVLLASVGRALKELRGPDEDPALIAQHGRLLWHAYRLWKAGEPVALVRTAALRALLEADAVEAWDGALPGLAGYVQLPQHLVWVRGAPDETPESLDGFFWAGVGTERLALLLAVGLRPDRPGFSVVPMDDLPLVDAPSWVSASMRPGGADFESGLPGAELEGLYELRSAGEAVKLAARCLQRLGGEAGATEGPPAGEAASPRPSALAHHIVDLDPE